MFFMLSGKNYDPKCSQILKTDKKLTSSHVFLLLPLFLLSTPAIAQPMYTFCDNGASNYTSNSTFENNLKHLLQSLPSNTYLSGFNITSIGNDANRVSGRALCRGDVTDKVCRICLENASREIMKECKSQEAIIWYESCQVHYSYLILSGMNAYTGKYPRWNNQEKNISDPQSFNGALIGLMRNLINKAAYDPSKLMFGTDQVKVSRSDTIYGLVQCTRDLTVDSCSQCLKSALGDLKACCYGRGGGTIFSRSCNMRFGLTCFYNTPSVKGEWKTWMIVLVICAPMFAAAVLAGSCAVLHYRRRTGTQNGRPHAVDEGKSQHDLLHNLVTPTTAAAITQEFNSLSSEELSFMEVATIRAATNEFSDSNKLGHGGFGTVYKGVLPNGKEIAVKRLSRKSSQGIDEFKNEIGLISKLQHRNLVRLLGCGIEEQEKLLVYEFLPNKSLDIFIFDAQKRKQLKWEICFNIIDGIARGLVYLHEDSRLKIIHRDLKPHNVLMDSDMAAKISDFGMARIFGENQIAANTCRIVGTYGYMAPEYAMDGMFSVKSDVFSFGVILLEIITGNRSSGFYLTGHGLTLPAYVWKLWNEGKVSEFIHPSLTESCAIEIVLRCIHIGLLCVQENPADRPTMSSVVVLLESKSMPLPEPTQPPFSVGSAVLFNQSPMTSLSVNELTVSSFLPR